DHKSFEGARVSTPESFFSIEMISASVTVLGSAANAVAEIIDKAIAKTQNTDTNFFIVLTPFLLYVSHTSVFCIFDVINSCSSITTKMHYKYSIYWHTCQYLPIYLYYFRR